MNKVLLVIAQKDFRDGDFQRTRQALADRKVTVHVAAKTRQAAIGSAGLAVQPDVAIGEVRAEEFRAVIFIGGAGIAAYRNDDVVLKFIQAFRQSRRIIAALADAPVVLADAGILLSKAATAMPGYEQYLLARGALYSGMDVERDGMVVTARDADAIKPFVEEIIYLLNE